MEFTVRWTWTRSKPFAKTVRISQIGPRSERMQSNLLSPRVEEECTVLHVTLVPMRHH